MYIRLRILRLPIILLALLLILSTVLAAGCGIQAPVPAPAPPVLPGAPPAPTGNQPPVISTLNPAVTSTAPGGTVRIQAQASDPEGETPIFQWSASGGSFDTAVGPIVTWIAPSIYGTYNISVIVSDSKGGTAQRTVVLSVQANQNPNIASLVADPALVVPGPGPGSTSVVTAIASDSDDVIGPNSYGWTATDGTITGVGNKITWQAPSKGGDFYVKVTVNDGRGGTVNQQVLIRVVAQQNTVVINLTEAETGTVWSNGFVERRLIVGDDQRNTTARAFFSFNIFPFAGKQITNATLSFTTGAAVGNTYPATALNGLFVEEVRYGARPLQPVDYDIPGTSEIPAFMGPPTDINVTANMQRAANAATGLFQLRLRFGRATEGNAQADYQEFISAKLTITFKEKDR